MVGADSRGSRRRPVSLCALALGAGVAGSAGCTSRGEAPPTPVAATAIALDARSVEVTFSERIVPESVDAAAMRIFAPLSRPITELAVEGASGRGSVLTVATAEQEGGVLYALQVGALELEGIERADLPTQINFRGFGLADVVISLDTTGFVVPASLAALVTLGPGGEHSEELRSFPLTESSRAGVYTATVAVRVEPDQLFAARAIGASGEEAGQLTTFRVSSAARVEVPLNPLLPRVPEFEPPVDTRPGDGFAPVRIVYDDRPARALRRPELRSSLDASGRFDLSVQRLDTLQPSPGKPRVFEVTVEVAVDPERAPDGTTPETFPYVAFLVESGEDIPQRGLSFVMPVEEPQVVVVPVGNPALVPVTFRVDIGSAVLEPDLGVRGKYPGEGIFLTGELPQAEDALGRLAADTFTGGERTTLELAERPDAPGIYEKTVFMVPNRPAGWKVLRCPTGQGCTELNRHVLSSGRAFPTVMKNLVTENVDASASAAVKVLDPASLDMVDLGGGVIEDYSRARVSSDGSESRAPTVMFKQEVPDLVVSVGTTPHTTPIVVVGTWRDVNIPQTPAQIIAENLTLELGPFDYDDGMQGRAPPIRDLDLPEEPGRPQPVPGQPAFLPRDGEVDRPARPLSVAGRLPLWVAWNERELYVATSPARPGRDHFILVSLVAPLELRPAHWAKAGTEAGGARQVFLAMEGDGDFAGWFQRGTSGGNDAQLMGAGIATGRGVVLEGTIDAALAGAGGFGDRVWIAAVEFETADGGALDPSTQNPPGNGDLNVDLVELTEVVLSTVRAE